MKDLSHKTIFGKEVSHEDELKSRIKSKIVNIIMDEESVSEKSFSKVDDIVNRVNNIFDDSMFKLSEKMYSEGKRINYIAESIYDTYIKNSAISESVITKFKDFI